MIVSDRKFLHYHALNLPTNAIDLFKKSGKIQRIKRIVMQEMTAEHFFFTKSIFFCYAFLSQISDEKLHGFLPAAN